MERLIAHPAAALIVVVSWTVSVICVLRMWRNPGSIPDRLFWSLLVFIPVLGPLLFLALYSPPAPGEFPVRTWRSESGEGRH